MAVDGVIVNTNRPGHHSAGNKPDSSDLSTSAHNSVVMPNPYHSTTTSGTGNNAALNHSKYWAPTWMDYSKDQINDERRLFNYLMRNYDTNIRPVINASDSINIRLGVTLAQIFDLVSGEIYEIYYILYIALLFSSLNRNF